MEISQKSRKFGFLPDLTFSFSTNISNSDYNSDGIFFDINNDFTNVNSYTLSCNLSYSLWNFLKHGESYKKFKRTLKSNIISYNKEKKDLKQNYEEQKRNLENLIETYNLYQTKLDLAQKNYLQSSLKYEAGIINLLDFD